MINILTLWVLVKSCSFTSSWLSCKLCDLKIRLQRWIWFDLHDLYLINILIAQNWILIILMFDNKYMIKLNKKLRCKSIRENSSHMCLLWKSHVNMSDRWMRRTAHVTHFQISHCFIQFTLHFIQMLENNCYFLLTY